MAAVEVSDVTTLARIPEPGPDATERAVRSVTDAPSGYEGEGFPVRRAFAGVALTELDPFVHLDQLGPVEYAPGEARGTGWHPHRGFESVTYMIEGSLEHQDSRGGSGVTTSGGTQWLTTGAGVLHLERPPQALVTAGGAFHGVALWVNLPRSRKFSEPRYQDLHGEDSVVLAAADGATMVRLIAGSIGETAGPASTNTPLTVAHAILDPRAELRLPWRADFNALVYALSGSATIGADATPLRSGQLAVLGAGEAITIAAAAEGLDVIVLGGEPIREPIVWGGPFVMNSDEEVRRAFDDYEGGRFGRLPATTCATTSEAAPPPKSRTPLTSASSRATSRLRRTPWTERRELLKRVLADRPADR